MSLKTIWAETISDYNNAEDESQASNKTGTDASVQ